MEKSFRLSMPLISDPTAKVDHTKSNSILLRKDIHSVFDAGYATVDENYRFLVSKKVKEVFNNGEEYLRLDGKTLRLPIRKPESPNLDFR
jgi:putative restriction endonuclease